jgi:hypothetical protein
MNKELPAQVREYEDQEKKRKVRYAEEEVYLAARSLLLDISRDFHWNFWRSRVAELEGT